MKRILKNRNVIILLAVTVIISIFSSCKKKEDVPAETPVITSMKDLKVDPNFDWSTSKPVGIDIRMLDNSDHPVPNMRVDVYTDDPENGGHIMVSGMTDQNGYFKCDYRIPAYQKSVAIGTRAIGFVNMQTVNVTDGLVKCVLGGKTVPARFKSTGSAKGFTSVNTVFKPLATYNFDGVPSNLEPINDNIDATMLSDINATLPEYISAPTSHPAYFNTNNEHGLVVLQPCDVWVTFVHEGAGYRNVLGYYKFNHNTPPTSTNSIDTVHIIFPNVSFANSGGGLYAGNRVHIGTFASGTEIGWCLVANGFYNGNFVNGNWKVYSDDNLNPENNAALRQHVILLNDLGRGKYLLSFEDLRRDQGADNDFNDAVFYVTANPVSAVNPANLPMPNYTQSDSDQDGVPNNFDDYPNDPTRAFNNFYPSQSTNGTLAFEDLWPNQGDYDMNDIVVDYNFNQITNGQNLAVGVTGALTLRAMGAGYKNGFGIQLPISNSLISSVTGSNLSENYIVLNPNGTEAGQSKATIIVFDNGYNVLQKPAGDNYVGVNTTVGGTFVPPVTMNITINFTAPVNLSQLGTPPYNPFIIVNKERGREIHLVNKPPTDKANAALFGTGNDNTIPASGKYYSTANNLPWAFDIIDPFDYPKEKSPILEAYNKFAPWSVSSGAVNYDWFQDKSGYRNATSLYHH